MPGALNLPIGADEFAQLLDDFAPPLSATSVLALAVSGGPDSMALASCIKRWTQQEASTGRDIIAFIVDHGLRIESAAEAAQTKNALLQIGIRAEILRWEHAPVTTGLHQKAREARYRLLTEACRHHDARDLLIAHHQDDQAETILMRFAKGSGIEGLAGMEKQTVRDGIRLLRPFLSIAKERLIETCRAASVPFIVDASNAQEKFARGRLRKIMPLLAEEGMTVENLVGLGARAAEARDALDYYTKSFLRDAAQCEVGGSVRIDRALLREIPRAVGLRALTACLRYVHDDRHPPEYAALSSLFGIITDTADETTRTLYGCIASIAANHVTLLREPSAVCEVLPLPAGETVLWDNRWLVTAQGTNLSLRIRALGNPPHELIDRLAPALRRQIPQGRVRASLPALWRENELCAIPSFDPTSALHIAYRKQSFP